jgi:hypothetical protein
MEEIKTVTFTEDKINTFTEAECKRFIIGYSDGQGDSYLESLYEIKFYYPDETNIGIINNLYNEYGGNMVKIKWFDEEMLNITIL